METIESCAKCGKVIGLIEHVYVHDGLIICKECNDKYSSDENERPHDIQDDSL